MRKNIPEKSHRSILRIIQRSIQKKNNSIIKIEKEIYRGSKGYKGDKGDKGDRGKTGSSFVWKGKWSSQKIYRPNEIVQQVYKNLAISYN